MNPQMLIGMLGNNPMFQQAQKMIQSGGNPQEIINNVIKEKPNITMPGVKFSIL